MSSAPSPPSPQPDAEQPWWLQAILFGLVIVSLGAFAYRLYRVPQLDVTPASFEAPFAASIPTREAAPIAAPRAVGPTTTRPLVRERAARRPRPVRLIMYSTSWCPRCTEARDWLVGNDIPFQEYNVEMDVPIQAHFRAINPRQSIPTFEVGRRVLIGFSPGSLLNAMRRAR